MRTRTFRALSALTVVSGLALTAPAAAAPPLPFGHTCAPLDGALACPTASDATRVPSFDGVPLDVDVFLPPTGDGPFPTIAMLHGFAGSKADPEAGGPTSTTNAAFYARNGYAVVVPSARGFGRSCGVPASRTPDCARGWLHLADQRFEARDVQDLLGLLVDEGVARADALASTGISYGGGQTLELALLRDRIVTPSGATAPWTSPAGRPLSLAAAWARWPWSDLADALLPNGRLGPATVASPVGVPIQAWLGLLSSAAVSTGFVAPPGADPGADLVTWNARIGRGEPYGADVRAVQTELHRFHSALGVPAPRRTPLLIQAGFTDDLFPIGQSVRPYDLLRAGDPRAPVALQLGDLGHNRAANHPVDAAQMAAQALRFFDARLKGNGTGPAPGSVTAYLQSCPRSAPRGGGPVTAASFSGLARGTLRLSSDASRRVTSTGGSASLAARLNPLRLDPCRSVAPVASSGTAVLRHRAARAFTLLGRTDISARVRVRGSGAQLDGRLWDVDPSTGRQRLVDRGGGRLRSARTVRFGLDGNGWRVARGHTVKVELLGRDAPTYRASNGAFSVTVSRVRVALPTRERQPG